MDCHQARHWYTTMAVRQIYEQAQTEGEVKRRLPELIEYMKWRSGDALLEAYQHYFDAALTTHAVQVEKIPVDIVGAWLKQKNLDVTDYYSQPTARMVGEAADQFLTRVAAHVHVGEAVRRSPDELRKAFEEVLGKAGTLAQVTGGHCVSHGFCAAKFASVGCAGKVPDPAFRSRVERHKAWAMIQVDFALQEGLLPGFERMKQLVRDCETELQEMSQIEAYRRDEERAVHIRVEAAEHPGVAAGKGPRTEASAHGRSGGSGHYGSA